MAVEIEGATDELTASRVPQNPYVSDQGHGAHPGKHYLARPREPYESDDEREWVDNETFFIARTGDRPRWSSPTACPEYEC
jgi:hypothetical protein